MPLRVPTESLSPEQFDLLLAAGYRRSGWYFYRTACPNCSACEPLRIEASQFKATRSQRRTKKLGDRDLRTQFAAPTIDARRLELFNRHRSERRLSQEESGVDGSQYAAFLTNSHTEVLELSLWHQEQLIAVSITDVGAVSLSAVYCYFDPDFSQYSLGTYAILQQVEMTKAIGYRWLYLGLYVPANQHLKYKSNFGPNERFVAQQWARRD